MAALGVARLHAAYLEDGNEAAMCVGQIVVEGQQHHEGEEHGQSREEVPDVVEVVEVEEDAALVLDARLGRRQGPGYRLLADEEVEGAAPGEERQEDVEGRLQLDFLAVAELCEPHGKLIDEFLVIKIEFF